MTIDEELLTPVTDRIMKYVRLTLESLKKGCVMEDNELMNMLGEIEKIRHLY
jgi:hypothetical protein